MLWCKSEGRKAMKEYKNPTRFDLYSTSFRFVPSHLPLVNVTLVRRLGCDFICLWKEWMTMVRGGHALSASDPARAITHGFIWSFVQVMYLKRLSADQLRTIHRLFIYLLVANCANIDPGRCIWWKIQRGGGMFHPKSSIWARFRFRPVNDFCLRLTDNILFPYQLR